MKCGKKNWISLIILLFLFLGFLCSFFYLKQVFFRKNKKGSVLVLDGPSCSGKTSVAKELIQLLDASYEVVSLDSFVTDLFLEHAKKNFSREEFLQKICHKRDLMYDKIAHMIEQGRNVLLDSVLSALEGDKDVQHGFDRLKDFDVYMVLAYCPLYKIVERLKQRNVQAFFEKRPRNMRSIFATLQFANCYKKQEGDQTASMAVGSLSRKDLEISYFTKKNRDVKKFMRFNTVKEKLLVHFDLKDNDCVKIIPQLAYDCVVNTSKKSPFACAQEIYDCFNHCRPHDMRAFFINKNKIKKCT